MHYQSNSVSVIDCT